MTTTEAQWITLGFIFAIIAAVIGYDVVIIKCFGPDASISRVTAHCFVRWPIAAPIVMFALGAIAGHTWFPACER